MCLEIGGVCFHIASPQRIIFDDPEDLYTPFLAQPSGNDHRIDVRVELTDVAPPDLSNLDEVFSCGTWRLFRDGEIRYLALDTQSKRQPIWTARLSPSFRSVTVFCGNHLLREKDGIPVVACPVRYPLDQLLLMYALSTVGGVLVHSAGAAAGKRGLLFPGRSTAGKSTLARLLIAHHADTEFDVLSDDRIVVRRIDGQYRMFGTPWAGELGKARNRAVDLDSLFFLTKSSRNEITPVSTRVALDKLLPATSILWFEADIVQEMLTLCGDLLSSVPTYEFLFTPETDATELIDRFIRNSNTRASL